MGKEIRHKISAQIRKLRQKRGLTQDKLSELSRIRYKYIQQIEGKNPPNIRVDTLARIAKALKTTFAKLLDC